MRDTRRLKPSRCVLLAAALFSALRVAAPMAAETEPVAQPTLEAIGKALYRRGHYAPAHTLRGTVAGVAMPPAALACANCHGADGRGAREARVGAPALRGAVIDAEGLRRALATRPEASSAMAHYEIESATARALLAYLQVLGTERDAEPGVDDQVIRLGALLPISGAMAELGAVLAATLRGEFARINAEGGIYGRRLELVLHDAEPEGLTEFARSDSVFALVASFLPSDDGAGIRLLADAELPVVGALTSPAGDAARASREVHYLVPGLHDQARGLIDHIASLRSTETRVTVVASEGAAYRDAAVGAQRQAAHHPQLSISVVDAVKGSAAATPWLARVTRERSDYLLFFGPPEALETVARRLDQLKWPTPVLTSALIAGPVFDGAPRAWSRRLVVARPEALVEAPARFEGEAHAILRAMTVEAVASASDALKRSGRQLTRARFAGELDRLASTSASQAAAKGSLSVMARDAQSDRWHRVAGPFVPRD